MAITRLNHAVLYVRDVRASVAFYGDVLGFRSVLEMPGAAFLRADGSTNDHDLGLFEIGSEIDAAAPSGAGRGRVGLYHLAWEVDTLRELAAVAERLAAASALVGASDHTTTKSLYARDPDGLELEVCWIVPADRLAELPPDADRSPRPRALDLPAEIRRYGADTRGGLGVSFPVAAA